MVWAGSDSASHPTFCDRSFRCMQWVQLQCPALREGASSLPLLLLGLNTLSQVPPHPHAVLLCHRSLLAEMTSVSPLRHCSLWVLVVGW